MSAKLTLEGSGAGAVRAISDLNKAIEKTEKGLTLTAREAKKLENAAGSVVKANEQPLERYNRRVAETAKLVAAGKLSHDEAAKAVQRYGIQLDNAGKAKERAFGGAALSQLMSYATGMFSIGSAIAVVTKAFNEAQAAKEAAGARTVGGTDSAGELAQLFTSEEEYKAAVAEARSYITSGIFKPDQQKEAFKYTFALRSAGYDEEERNYLARVGQSKNVAPESLLQYAASLKKVQDIFGKAETGSISDIANKVIQTSTFTQSNASQVALAATKFGASGRALGISDEASFAALAAIEKSSKDIDTASTQLDALYAATSKKGLKGRTIPDILAEISAAEQGGANLYKLLGRKEAVAAYRALTTAEGAAVNADALGKISTAAERDIVGIQMGLPKTDPRIRASMLAGEAQGRLASTEEEQYAERELLVNMVRAAMKEHVTKLDGAFAASLTDWGVTFKTSRGFLERSQGAEWLTEEQNAAIVDYLRRTAESTERQEKNGGSNAPQPFGNGAAR